MALLVITAYSGVVGNSFTWLDDPAYVTQNPQVLRGLSWDGLRWAFSLSGYAANWHPLTWVSHMIDVQLFGVNAGAHHLVSVAIHGLNAVLLFEFLRRATGNRWRSAFAAALFSAHPLHVESVAWISERKDVLAMSFWLITSLAYLRYTAAPSATRYLPLILFFAAGLMTKPMLVTLPLALLLLDYWPLGRYRGPASLRGVKTSTDRRPGLLLEKAPLAALSCASAAVTLVVQWRGGMVKTFEEYPPGFRAANAVVSLCAYLRKLAWPADLALPYVNADVRVATAHLLLAAAVLLAVTLVVVQCLRVQPFLLTGWLWFLATLFPVIGLIHIADQTMADRYAYVPAIGVYMAVTWGAARLLPPSRAAQTLALAGATTALTVLVSAAHTQVGLWRDDETLFRHTVGVTDRNWLAENALGNALFAKGRLAEAAEHFTAALRTRPEFAAAHNNLGLVLAAEGNLAGAAAEYSSALRALPSCSEAYNNLGVTLMLQSRYPEAIGHFKRALELAPDSMQANASWGNALVLQGRPGEAVVRYREAIRLNPYNAESWTGLGISLLRSGGAAEAIPCFSKAIEINPRQTAPHFHLAEAFDAIGDADKARLEYRTARQLDPVMAQVLDYQRAHRERQLTAR